MTAIALAQTAVLQSGAGKSNVTREEQFNQLIAVYMDDLYRYGYWLSGSHAVADDLVQETLVRAWKSMDKLNDAKAVKGWLLTILRRENARRFERKRPSGERHSDRGTGRGPRRTMTPRPRPSFCARRWSACPRNTVNRC